MKTNPNLLSLFKNIHNMYGINLLHVFLKWGIELNKGTVPNRTATQKHMLTI